MERHAACVDHKRRFVFENKEFNLILYPRLRQVFKSVGTAEPLCRRFLDYPLAVRKADEPAFYAVTLYRELIVPSDVILPRH